MVAGKGSQAPSTLGRPEQWVCLCVSVCADGARGGVMHQSLLVSRSSGEVNRGAEMEDRRRPSA